MEPDEDKGDPEQLPAAELELYRDENKEDYPKLGNVVILGSKPTNDAKVNEIAKKINAIDDGLNNPANLASISEEIELKFEVDDNETNTTKMSLIDEGITFNDEDTNTDVIKNEFCSDDIKVEFCDLPTSYDNNKDDAYGIEIVKFESKVEEEDHYDIISIKSECNSSPSLKLVYSSEEESVDFNTICIEDISAKTVESDVNVATENYENYNLQHDNSANMDIIQEIDDLISNTGTGKSKGSNDIECTVNNNLNDDDDVIIIEDDDDTSDFNGVFIKVEAQDEEKLNEDDEDASNATQSNNEPIDKENQEPISVIKVKEEIIIIDDETTENCDIPEKDNIKPTNKRKIKRRNLNNFKYKCVVCSKVLQDYFKAETHRKFYHGHMTRQFIFKKLKAKKQALKSNYFKKFYNKMLNDLKSELLKTKIDNVTANNDNKLQNRNTNDNNKQIKDKFSNNNAKNKSINNDNKQINLIEDEIKGISNESKGNTMNLYQCECGLLYLSKHSLKRHMNTCDKKELNQKCFICCMTIPKQSYFAHLKEHEATKNTIFYIIDHKSSDGKTSDAEVTSRKCDIMKVSEKVKSNKADKSDKNSQSKRRDRRIKTKTNRKLRKLKPQSYKEDFEDDINTKLTRYYKCYKCPVYYRSTGGAEYHLSKGHNKPPTTTCDICKIQLNTTAFETHTSLHNNNINYFLINVFGESCKIIESYIHNVDDMNDDSDCKEENEDNGSDVSESTDDDDNDSDSQDTDSAGDEQQTIYKCKECFINFPTNATFLDHMFYRRDNKACNKDEETRFCQYCGKRFYTKFIGEHEEKHHKDKKVSADLTVIDKDPNKVIKAQSSEAKILKSSNLVTKYKSKNKISNKRTSKVNSNKTKPKHVSKSEKDTTNCNNSAQANGTKKLKLFKCTYCSSYFKRKPLLDAHRKQCTAQKIRCQYCNEEFLVSDLIEHIQVHVNMNPTNEAFKRKDKKDTNKKPNETANTYNNGNNNVALHKNNNDYQETNSLELLTNEQSNIEKVQTLYKCGQCLVHLNTLEDLYTHMYLRVHFEDKDIVVCRICKLGFSTDSFICHANLHLSVVCLTVKVENYNTIEEISARIAQNRIERSKSAEVAKLRAVRIRSRQSEDRNTEVNFPTREEIAQVFNDLEQEAIKILETRTEAGKRGLEPRSNREIRDIMTENCDEANISIQHLITASVESTFHRSDYSNLCAANTTGNINNIKTIPSGIFNDNISQKQSRVNLVENDKATKQFPSEHNSNVTNNIQRLKQQSDKHLRYLLSRDDSQLQPIDFSIKGNINSKNKASNNFKANKKQTTKKVHKNVTNTTFAEVNPYAVNYNVNNYDNSNNIYVVGGNANIPINSNSFKNNNTNQTANLINQSNTSVQRTSLIKNPCHTNNTKIVSTSADNINNDTPPNFNTHPQTQINRNIENYAFANYEPSHQGDLITKAATSNVKSNKRTNAKPKRNVNSKKTKTSTSSYIDKINELVLATAKTINSREAICGINNEINNDIAATDGNNTLAAVNAKIDLTNTRKNKAGNNNSSKTKQLINVINIEADATNTVLPKNSVNSNTNEVNAAEVSPFNISPSAIDSYRRFCYLQKNNRSNKEQN